MVTTAPPLSPAAYYRHPAVRERIREYCGGGAGAPLTCAFVSGLHAETGETWNDVAVRPPADLEALLDTGADIARSMWDSRSLLVHLDVDYQHFDRPADAFEFPADIFLKLEPVRRAIAGLLDALGLPLLAVMTGRGYHFTGRVPWDTQLIPRLARLAPVPAWLQPHAARCRPWTPPPLTETQARAYLGIGMLIEFFAQEIIRRAGRASHIPLVVNGTVVGWGPHGRECTSLDFSYAGEPLDVRHMRVPYSTYQRRAGAHAAPGAPLVAVPLASRSFVDVLQDGRDPDAAAALAATGSARMPVVSAGVENLLEAYDGSALAAFHKMFYESCASTSAPAGERDLRAYVGRLFRAGAVSPELKLRPTYEEEPLDAAQLVPCVQRPLERPNDLLLKPAQLQHVVRYLLGLGWKTGDIARLIQRGYEGDYQWGTRWTRMDPQARAEFYVRVFAGMIATGVDRGVDFNCQSAQEKELCPGDPCRHDLRVDRDRLLGTIAS